VSIPIDPATLADQLRGLASRLHFADAATAAYKVRLYTRTIPYADLVPGANEVETYLNTARENVRSGVASRPVVRQYGDWSVTFARGRCVSVVNVSVDGFVTFETAMPGNVPDASEPIDQLIARGEAVLSTLQSAPEEKRTALALQFGYDIGEIGRRLTLQPGLQPLVRAFVERTAPVLENDFYLARWFGRVYAAADSRGSETVEYVNALVLRSSLAFYAELYRDSVAGDGIAGIDIGDTDEQLKEWGAEQYLAEVPPGYPPSHVWWHQSLSGK
jgi:hypothetical protein